MTTRIRSSIPLAALAAILLGPAQTREVQITIPGAERPQVRSILPNGNTLVTDHAYDVPGTADVGAAFLLAPDGALISTLTGSHPGDFDAIGVTVLGNGNYVLALALWDNGALVDAGAVIWLDADTGLEGEISSQNALVGGQGSDRVGSSGVVALSNSNYLVLSPLWHGPAEERGALSWGGGFTGAFGVVSAANSLVGRTGFPIGNPDRLIRLANGHAMLLTPFWDSDTQSDVGAVTWIDGEGPMSGTITAANSLVGTVSDQRIGEDRGLALTNGHYVALSTRWSGVAGESPLAGAATWLNGYGPTSASISPANSLVGTSLNDFLSAYFVELANGNYLLVTPAWNLDGNVIDVGAVSWASGQSLSAGQVGPGRSLVGSSSHDLVGLGFGSVQTLSGGGYVVVSPDWDNGFQSNAGAVTWGNGLGVLAAPISVSNSLVGDAAFQQIGSGGVRTLANGHYVVSSPAWSGNRGAVTWGSGMSGVIGIVSMANSLVGSSNNDRVGEVLVALANGHYAVGSPAWDHGNLADAGAATWGNGQTGTTGMVGASNSLIGGSASDRVGSGMHPLANGHYVVRSPGWRDAQGSEVGAVTWRDGTGPGAGSIGPGNSMLGTGTSALDSAQVMPLRNGHYLIRSPEATIKGASRAGLVSWGNGTGGTTGTLGFANALLGRSANDQVGFETVELANGNYVVAIPGWDDNGNTNVGAVVWGNGMSGVSGQVSAANALVGRSAGDSTSSFFVQDQADGNYIVDWPGFDVTPQLPNAGALSLVRGSTGTRGEVSAVNSVLGNTAIMSIPWRYDQVGKRLVAVPGNASPIVFRSFDVLLRLAGAAAGTGITLTATLTGSRPTGSIRFTHGADQAIPGCEAVPLVGSEDVRTASCTTTVLPVTDVSVRARYAGDDNNDPGSTTTVLSLGLLFGNGFESP